MKANESLKAAIGLFESDRDEKLEKQIEKQNKEAAEKKMSESEKEIAEVISNALAVALAQIETLVGVHFDSVNDAERFIKEKLLLLKNKRRAELLLALRRFERLGGQRTQAIYRRGL